MRLGWGVWLLALLLPALFLVSPSFAQVTGTCSPACYGPGLASDGLVSTVIGGPTNQAVSYRFRAEQSASVTGVHIYLIPNRSGYSAGTGGQLRVALYADDGSSAHIPTGTSLANYVLTDPVNATPSPNFPVVTFSTPTTLVAGRLYHLVLTDVDSNPASNYLSIEALWSKSQASQPTLSADIGMLLRTGSVWAPRTGYTPIFQLDYQDGTSQGIGYLEAWIGAPQAISGTSAVREAFTISGPAKSATSLAISIAHVKGSDPLTVRLEDSDGTLIEQGQISSASIPITSAISYTWAKLKFSIPRLLLTGHSYNLVLQAPATSMYQAFPIRKGLDYGFSPTTYFPDGYAQFKQAGSWTGWTQWGVTNRTDSDLPFYFELAVVDPAQLQPPAISRVSSTSSGTTSQTITWTTDQVSSTQVEYGTTSAYGNMANLDSSLITDHSQALSQLQSGQQYHYRVHSTNAWSKTAVSDDFTFTTPAPPPPVVLSLGSSNCLSGCYGAGIGSDSLANTVVGGPSRSSVSYRFRAKHTGPLSGMHVYLLPDKPGYSLGTGGQISFTLNLDDGTSAHNPSSTAIASYVLKNPLSATPSKNFPLIPFTSQPMLTAGQLYHLVVTNVDASASSNYLSVDLLYTQGNPVPSQPTVSDMDNGLLVRGGSSSWSQRKGFTLIYQLDYRDGHKEGMGYIESWIGAPQNISGTASVRESFTVSGPSINVTQVAIRLARVSGTSPLVIRLENADGTLIEQGNVSSLPTSYSWASLRFSTTHQLVSGKSYNLVLQSASSSVYQAFPIRKGSAYSFDDATFFADGYAQFKQGSSWVGWTQWGTTNRKDGDLQFYFVVQ